MKEQKSKRKKEGQGKGDMKKECKKDIRKERQLQKDGSYTRENKCQQNKKWQDWARIKQQKIVKIGERERQNCRETGSKEQRQKERVANVRKNKRKGEGERERERNKMNKKGKGRLGSTQRKQRQK